MDAREQIIRLGKCLAAEAQAGYANAVKGGLESFIAAWAAEANGATDELAVRATLVRLQGYAALPADERKVRVDESLSQLRALFKAASQPQRATKSPASAPAAI